MSYDNPRIQLEDTLMDIFFKMSDGNPGGLRVMLSLYREAPKIDPQSAFEGLAPIMDLDNLDIYGSRIWVMAKDVCGQNLVHMLAVLRAVQLGILPRRELINAIDTHTALDTESILQKVMERLEHFNRVDLTKGNPVSSEEN